MLGWKKHKLESRLPGEISDMQMIPPLWQKVKSNSLEAVEGRGDLGVGLHAAQEAIDGGGNRFKSSNAVSCGEATIWELDPCSWAP